MKSWSWSLRCETAMRNCRDEIAQTKASLVEALAEKEQFKELSTAGEQKLKEQMSMLKDERRMNFKTYQVHVLHME
jgi:hypothetical protein